MKCGLTDFQKILLQFPLHSCHASDEHQILSISLPVSELAEHHAAMIANIWFAFEWGSSDIDWCEGNFDISPAVAEFWNTVSYSCLHYDCCSTNVAVQHTDTYCITHNA